MKDGGRGEQHAIESIEQTTVPGKSRRPVFDAEVPLDRGKRQIAELAGCAHQQAQDY